MIGHDQHIGWIKVQCNGTEGETDRKNDSWMQTSFCAQANWEGREGEGLARLMSKIDQKDIAVLRHITVQCSASIYLTKQNAIVGENKPKMVNAPEGLNQVHFLPKTLLQMFAKLSLKALKLSI